VSVARDCGMVLPYEQVIQITVKGDSHFARIDWEVVGVPQTMHRGSFSSDSVSLNFTSTCYNKNSLLCLSTMSLMHIGSRR
jgi:hypothetical protein